jgi:predicted esterase
MIRRTLLVFLAVFAIAIGVCYAASGKVVNLERGEYWIGEPKKASEPVGFCLALHGMGGDCASMGRLWHQALKEKYLVIAPQAHTRNRRGSMTSTWATAADREYLDQFFEIASKKYKIDPRKSVVVGFSAGTWPAVDMAARHPERIGGVVIQGGTGRAAPEKFKGVSVYLLSGERDGSFSPNTARSILKRLHASGINAAMDVALGSSHGALYDKIDKASAWVLNGFKETP